MRLAAPVIAAAFVRVASVAAALAFSLDAGAQILPGRPITVVVPFPPGASADAIMRVITKKVTDNTGQQFVIDNRSGGGASLSAIAVKQAPPDGHTLLEFVVGTHALNQSLGGDNAYDVRKDFEPVTQLWNFPLFLAIPASLPVKSVTELVAFARSKPGGLNYASTAINSASHLLGAMLALASGAPMVHVPYRGAAPALTDLMAGRVDLYFVSYASITSFVESGQLRVLGVASPHRLKAIPDVPTMAETGFPTVMFNASFGVTAPARTPEPVIHKLNEAFVAAASDPQFIRRMNEQGVEIVTNSPAEFKALIASEVDQLDKVLEAAGVKAR